MQERAAIPEERRRSTFIYIDEAQDYFDEGIENLLNQARKYRCGLVLAHQNLGQFEPKLQAAVMASTAIKLAGGVSAKDAVVLAREMRTDPEFLLSVRKGRSETSFACFVRNLTPQPLALSVPFGQMEGRPRMSEEEKERLLSRNRERFCATVSENGVSSAKQPPRGEKGGLTEPELL